MKNLGLLLIIIISSYNIVIAQSYINIRMQAKMDTATVAKYTVIKDPDTSIKTIVAHFNYNGTDIINKSELHALNDGLTRVLSVDYVYTQNEDIAIQNYINKKRFVELGLVVPFIIDQKLTKWTAVKQTGFDNAHEASKMMHAYVIRYTKIEDLRLNDAASIKKIINRRIQKPADSTIMKVFSRNPNMKKDVVVIDFTCSMNTYFIEVVSWFCLKEFKNQATYFAFFNDGDGKPVEQKKIGKTGGIHTFKTNNLDTIVKYIEKTISYGCSGDEVENDVEAVLQAMNDNPSCDEIILIADNWSDMRDYSLRKHLTKPLRIILCGTDYGINIQYLNLAKQTKGSIHTMNEDLTELYKMKEGSKFEMLGHEFIVRNGQIELIGKIKSTQ